MTADESWLALLAWVASDDEPCAEADDAAGLIEWRL